MGIRSQWGFWDLLERLGPTEVRRVFPDFAQVARYAWLAGDRRLQEIGIKTYQLRGQGTDFKQLSEYRVGDAVRHIDWRATLRLGKPIVREFQDERDQCVMLLSYVALAQGDAVGAMTFGTPPGRERSFAPRKGAQALNSLMGQLYDVQPTLTHSDYVAAARALLQRQRKRALVVGELIGQPLAGGDSAIDVAAAHLYEQARRDAFNRLATRDALMADAEPDRLGIELVNRYHAVKRAGLI